MEVEEADATRRGGDTAGDGTDQSDSDNEEPEKKVKEEQSDSESDDDKEKAKIFGDSDSESSNSEWTRPGLCQFSVHCDWSKKEILPLSYPCI